MIKKAVLPVAGLGTRFLPATKASPKEMLPILDKPIIQYAVEEAVKVGIEEFLFITGKHKRAIEDHFDKAYELEERLKISGKYDLLKKINFFENLNFAYIRQKEPKGLGDAIHCAKPFIKDEPFIVILSDDVIDPDYSVLSDMINIYNRTKSPVIALEEVSWEEVSRYGIVSAKKIDEHYLIEDMIEKPEKTKAPSNLAIIGRYILTPDIFKHLETLEPGKGGEIQLTDALKSMAKEVSIYGYKIKCKRYDAGEKFGYLKTIIDFALRDPEISSEFRKFLKEQLSCI
ncbi:MAG: UTP--glucose-1-phosphate uridylyltransferase GalU [Thermodesulfovibrio sp.]|uniref:UTP--glucose-1-phosphate uridylyltransferase GalU n=1 Tax=unclassified Thermodesulfovibrio TaxID=2645936 RepID=UPI00083AC39E|nr:MULTISPECIES: UTP--glucose-1-phosphate uridylyltransferase GalU [unclassified Thermodesulfovibrio]MDI1471351.1 UTP--glucose-1-phosphate uridylyltransferase GalU [Thermodesulfovibrio sp. 1176]MDI6714623.1 UTP--glucose-1-phosphate uridylyltransferase GalU [Thermodesulfovibrio sp.]ODA44305.1 UTP--glucose-1-phosphate uridylyltransferase [Thermodesulfovibrio sp. N1]